MTTFLPRRSRFVGLLVCSALVFLSSDAFIIIRNVQRHPKTLWRAHSKTPKPQESNNAPSSSAQKPKAASPAFVKGPSLETKPDYDKIVGPLGKQVDNLFLQIFRRQLAKQVGFDSHLPESDYHALMEITHHLNQNVADRHEIQQKAQATLRSSFPSWLPGAYAVLFSKPFPAFSARMNAWATWWAGTWLMGDCEINNVLLDDDNTVGKNQGLLVKRCRFLEESGCASICVNCCKIPTQNFFAQDMGLPLTMEPNYETFECQFSFGKIPTEMDDAFHTPCLSRCPTAGALREWHASSNNKGENQCQLMENVES